MEVSLLVLAAVFGAVVGSFLNVVILRLPKEDASIVFPASHCPQCQQPLTWYENIPLLSYLASPRQMSNLQGCNFLAISTGRALNGRACGSFVPSFWG